MGKRKMVKIAHVDLITGKIYGCKKGSWTWWHEKGHLKFNDLESTSLLKLIQNYIFWVWMILVTFKTGLISIILTAIFLSLFLGIDIYEEWWCNQYANKKTKKKNGV